MPPKPKTDALIIGGGIIGLACAYYLLKAGRTVRLIERDKIGAGASHGNCGLLFFSDLLPLCQPGTVRRELGQALRRTSPLYVKLDPDWRRLLWLLRFAAKCNRRHLEHAVNAREKLIYLSRRLYEALFAEERLACEWQKRGVLMVYKQQAAMDAYTAANTLLRPYGLAARALSKADLLRLEPALKQDVCGAWYHESDSHLRPEKLLEGLKGLLEKRGADIVEHCPVERLLPAGNAIAAVATPQGEFKADHVILAAGAWTPALAKPLGARLPIQPGKGYSLTLQRPEHCPRIPCYFHDTRVVATPWHEELRLGGTMEFSGLNTHLDPTRIESLKSAAQAYLRRPPDRPIREEWVGMRPMSYDDLPLIGRVPGRANLLVASGHGMMGLSMATGTGRLIADLVCGQAPAIDPAPFSPTRFQ